jgi:hypothetical protein
MTTLPQPPGRPLDVLRHLLLHFALEPPQQQRGTQP